MFTDVCAFGFLTCVIIVAFLSLFLFVRTPLQEQDPEDQAVTIYRMCRELVGTPTWADFKMIKLTIDKQGDEITITLASGDIVYNADHALRLKDRMGYDALIPTEINEYHPGAWVQYLIQEYESEMADRKRAATERKSQKFSKIDDSELFGVKNDSTNG